MRHLLRPALALAAMIGLWVAITIAATEGVAALLGVDASERLEPLTNVHLAEEALEGTYWPLRDLAFDLYVLVKAILVFGVGGFIANHGPKARVWIGYLPLFVGLALLRHLFVLLVSAGEPWAMRLAAAFALATFVIAFIVGRGFAVYRQGWRWVPN